MRTIAFDTETTGTDPKKDRIVTAFVGLYDSEVDGFVCSRDWLIAPVDVPLSEEASRVNGITNEFALENGSDPSTSIREIASLIQVMMDEGDTSIPICAYNAVFDLTLLYSELGRYGDKQWMPSPLNVVDPLVIDRKKDRYRKGGKKLTQVAPVYGVPVEEDAHVAEADCLMAARIANAQMEKFGLSDLTPEDLTALQAIWHAEWAEGFEKFLRSKGSVETISRDFPLSM